MKQGRTTGLFLLWLMLAWSLPAQAAVSVLLTGPAGEQTESFRAALQDQAGAQVSLVSSEDQAQLVLALGENAFRDALAGSLPVLGVHVSAETWRRVRDTGCRCTVVYREAAVADQLQLLAALLPAAKRVGVLLGPASTLTSEQLQSAGRLFDVRRLTRADQLAVELAEVLPRVDVLLAVPDSQLYNGSTARLVLLASYRQQVPIIGPDEPFVRAGSLASAHPSSSGLVRATLDMLQEFDQRGVLPEARHAASTFSINHHVAKSYGVPVPETVLFGAGMEESQ